MDKDTIIIIMLACVLLAYLLPRPYLRFIRKQLSRFVYWQWKKMSHLSAVIYSFLYDRLNGNT
jgi:hypothetical protein